MTTHARLSPSASHRWSVCPASVMAEAALPDRPSGSIFAEEGTAAHELAALALISGNAPSKWLHTKLPESHWPVDQAMSDHVSDYVGHCRYLAHAGAFAQYEVSVSYARWVPNGFGTADAIILDGHVLHVIDLKYGRGIAVSPIENSQLMLYALGAYDEFSFMAEIKTINLTICQPRIGEGEPQVWSISAEQLLKWGEWVKGRAELCLVPNPEFSPGEKQCMWCKASSTCPALSRHVADAISMDFADISNPNSLPNPNVMTDARLGTALQARKLISAWLDSVEEHVVERIEMGLGFPGYKLVEGRSNRKWANETVAEQTLLRLLEDNAYTRNLLSPAQAEKALGKKKTTEIADLIVKPAGAPTLVTDDDPRPSMGISVADDFD